MGRDEVSVVRANSEAFSRMDVDAMLELYAPDAVVVDRRRVSIGTFVGHDELRPYYLSIFHTASELYEDLQVIAHRGELVVADCEVRGRLANAPAGAPEVTVPYGLAITVKDGRISRLELYENGQDALAAVEGDV
ncbi:MAG TPA: nuclear transport factor 2 family protein [Solirubrobacteraceae bacterium]|nr:nuclear transport factor 2 family protein [Solirubrobacteraceae bacterium]